MTIADFIATAKEFVGQLEEPKNSNRGVVPDFANWYSLGKRDWRDFPLGMRGAPWCAAFCYLVGRLTYGTKWPVPPHVDVDKLQEWAVKNGCFVGEGAPEPGDIFVLRRGSGWGHAGIVTQVKPGGVLTVEGNTDGSGSREGNGVYARGRLISRRMGWVRWADVL